MKEISDYFDEISLSQEVTNQINEYLKNINESEGQFYQEQKNRLGKEQDKTHGRIVPNPRNKLIKS